MALTRATLAALLVVTLPLTGCAALRNEWSGKHGGPDIDAEVRTAVRNALPKATDVSVGSHKNGFTQEMDVEVTYPDGTFDQDDLLTAARAICGAATLTDDVFLEVTDGSTRTALDLASLASGDAAALDTPYEPTQVQIEVEGDCPEL